MSWCSSQSSKSTEHNSEGRTEEPITVPNVGDARGQEDPKTQVIKDFSESIEATEEVDDILNSWGAYWKSIESETEPEPNVNVINVEAQEHEKLKYSAAIK